MHDRAHVGLVDAHAERGGGARPRRSRRPGSSPASPSARPPPGRRGRARPRCPRRAGARRPARRSPAGRSRRPPGSAPGAPSSSSRTAGLAASLPTRSTAKNRFGRSKPVRGETGSRSSRPRTMSPATRRVAVAVSAIVGGEPSRVADVRQPQVVRPEVVPPLRQAVRLVDRQPARRRQPRSPPGTAGSRTAPGRRRAGAPSRPRTRASVSATASRVMLEAIISTPSRPRARSARVLVLHQRDQRRDDQRQLPVDQRRQLVAERLARAGGHDREHVAAGQRRLARLALPRPEVGEPEPAAQLVGQIGGRRAHRTIVPEGSGPPGRVP